MRLEGLSFFGSVDGRGRGARGPRALAPLHLRGCARRRAGGMMTTRPGIAAVNYDGRVASCRAAGPTDHACGPDTFPFLDRPTGEVGARRAFGPSPPGTSEVAHPSKGKRDDGGLAWTYGASARKPSAPETYGGLVWNNPAGRGSTRGEDSTGRDEDAKHLAWLRAVLGGGGRIDSWPVLAFGAKWIISGRQREFDADGRPTSQMHSYGTVCNLCIG